MKLINQHNLDEWLFDYFEGNLNEIEKTVLIDYVENNTDAEKEFKFWKKSYTKLDEPIPSLIDLQKSLLKETWFAKYRIHIISSTVILAVGTLFFYLKSDNAPEKQIIIQPTKIEELKANSIKKVETPKLKQIPNVVKKNSKIDTISLEKPLHIQIDSLETKPIMVIETELEPIEDIKPIQERTITPKATSKPIKKRKLIYDIAPVNSNF